MSNEMTFSQAYYRMVIQEDGLTERAFERCRFCAMLVVEFKISEIWNEMYPVRPVFMFNPEHYFQIETYMNRFHWAKNEILNSLGIPASMMGQ